MNREREREKAKLPQIAAVVRLNSHDDDFEGPDFLIYFVSSRRNTPRVEDDRRGCKLRSRTVNYP